MGNKQIKKKKIKKDNNNNKKEENKKEIYKYNITFLGDDGVGTITSLIKKIMGDKFIPGRLVQRLILEKDNIEIRLNMFDVSDEKWMLSGILVKCSDFIILGYNMTNELSFEKIKDFYCGNKKNIKTNLIYLLGNKNDSKNEIKVPESNAKSFANSENIKYFSISIKDDIDIKSFIDDLKSTIDKKLKDDINKVMNAKLTGNPIQKKYKAVLLGEAGIGSKTNLLNVITDKGFNPNSISTSGASYESKSFMSKRNEEIIFEFWDTVGQEKHRKLTKMFIIDSDVIILGFDITSYHTFEEVKDFWYPFINENSKADLIYLLGNKIDLIKEGYEYKFEEEVKNFSKENNLRYFAISCQTKKGIYEFIDDLVNEV